MVVSSTASKKAADKNVVYASNDSAITVTNAGNVTAVSSNLKKGSLITIQNTSGSASMAIIPVVKDAAPKSIVATATSLTLPEGGVQEVGLKVMPNYGITTKVTIASDNDYAKIYEDEACTKPITASTEVTLSEGIGKIYVKYTGTAKEHTSNITITPVDKTNNAKDVKIKVSYSKSGAYENIKSLTEKNSKKAESLSVAVNSYLDMGISVSPVSANTKVKWHVQYSQIEGYDTDNSTYYDSEDAIEGGWNLLEDGESLEWDVLDDLSLLVEGSEGGEGSEEATKTDDHSNYFEIVGGTFKAKRPGSYIISAETVGTDSSGNTLKSSNYAVNVYTPISGVKFTGVSFENTGSESGLISNGNVVVDGYTLDAKIDCGGIIYVNYDLTIPESANTIGDDVTDDDKSYLNNLEPITWTSSDGTGLSILGQNIVEYYDEYKNTLQLSANMKGKYTITGTTMFSKQKFTFKINVNSTATPEDEESADDAVVETTPSDSGDGQDNGGATGTNETGNSETGQNNGETGTSESGSGTGSSSSDSGTTGGSSSGDSGSATTKKTVKEENITCWVNGMEVGKDGKYIYRLVGGSSYPLAISLGGFTLESKKVDVVPKDTAVVTYSKGVLKTKAVTKDTPVEIDVNVDGSTLYKFELTVSATELKLTNSGSYTSKTTIVANDSFTFDKTFKVKTNYKAFNTDWYYTTTDPKTDSLCNLTPTMDDSGKITAVTLNNSEGYTKTTTTDGFKSITEASHIWIAPVVYTDSGYVGGDFQEVYVYPSDANVVSKVYASDTALTVAPATNVGETNEANTKTVYYMMTDSKGEVADSIVKDGKVDAAIVSWTSSNRNIAYAVGATPETKADSVTGIYDQVKIVGVAPGTATITGVTSNGGKKVSIKVTVVKTSDETNKITASEVGGIKANSSLSLKTDGIAQLKYSFLNAEKTKTVSIAYTPKYQYTLYKVSSEEGNNGKVALKKKSDGSDLDYQVVGTFSNEDKDTIDIKDGDDIYITINTKTGIVKGVKATPSDKTKVEYAEYYLSITEENSKVDTLTTTTKYIPIKVTKAN
jgi:hypothetical protein